MTTANRFMGLLVNNTGCDIGGIFEDAIRDANGGALSEEIAVIFAVEMRLRDANCGALSEEIADIFAVEIVNVDGEDRLIVTMKDD